MPMIFPLLLYYKTKINYGELALNNIVYFWFSL